MTTLLNLFLVLFLLLSVSTAREVRSSGPIPIPIRIECTSVYGVKIGDTCLAVEQMFNLTTAKFEEINPNLNCKALFVGQWLCTDGFRF
ncbi:hypothetical protein BT93_L2447 [Corymbia citriodora subsp. variegata]|uniref:LysM domain-containing protein n=1 Tax=Corymbia citriodora subsp. variegata TaxID=360336 RepID=A0A8T0CJQ5_CORYI|nr:hypothetical protein BT93_L2447 [Corymbia citriodora subsp. variegata]